MLTVRECEAMVSAAETPRDRALVLFLWGSGCRISEACAALRGAYNAVEQRCRVIGKGDRERYVEVPARACVELDRYLRTRGFPGAFEPLFASTRGRFLDWRSGWKLVKRVARRAGLDWVHPHAFRHTCATQLLEAGVDLRYVQAYLGHLSGRSTELYTHVARGALRSAAAAHPMEGSR